MRAKEKAARAGWDVGEDRRRGLGEGGLGHGGLMLLLQAQPRAATHSAHTNGLLAHKCGGSLIQPATPPPEARWRSVMQRRWRIGIACACVRTVQHALFIRRGGYFGQDLPMRPTPLLTHPDPPLIILWGAVFVNQIGYKTLPLQISCMNCHGNKTGKKQIHPSCLTAGICQPQE